MYKFIKVCESIVCLVITIKLVFPYYFCNFMAFFAALPFLYFIFLILFTATILTGGAILKSHYIYKYSFHIHANIWMSQISKLSQNCKFTAVYKLKF